MDINLIDSIANINARLQVGGNEEYIWPLIIENTVIQIMNGNNLIRSIGHLIIRGVQKNVSAELTASGLYITSDIMMSDLFPGGEPPNPNYIDAAVYNPFETIKISFHTNSAPTRPCSHIRCANGIRDKIVVEHRRVPTGNGYNRLDSFITGFLWGRGGGNIYSDAIIPGTNVYTIINELLRIANEYIDMIDRDIHSYNKLQQLPIIPGFPALVGFQAIGIITLGPGGARYLYRCPVGAAMPANFLQFSFNTPSPVDYRRDFVHILNADADNIYYYDNTTVVRNHGRVQIIFPQTNFNNIFIPPKLFNVIDDAGAQLYGYNNLVSLNTTRRAAYIAHLHTLKSEFAAFRATRAAPVDPAYPAALSQLSAAKASADAVSLDISREAGVVTHNTLQDTIFRIIAAAHEKASDSARDIISLEFRTQESDADYDYSAMSTDALNRTCDVASESIFSIIRASGIVRHDIQHLDTEPLLEQMINHLTRGGVTASRHYTSVYKAAADVYALDANSLWRVNDARSFAERMTDRNNYVIDQAAKNYSDTFKDEIRTALTPTVEQLHARVHGVINNAHELAKVAAEDVISSSEVVRHYRPAATKTSNIAARAAYLVAYETGKSKVFIDENSRIRRIATLDALKSSAQSIVEAYKQAYHKKVTEITQEIASGEPEAALVRASDKFYKLEYDQIRSGNPNYALIKEEGYQLKRVRDQAEGAKNYLYNSSAAYAIGPTAAKAYIDKYLAVLASAYDDYDVFQDPPGGGGARGGDINYKNKTDKYKNKLKLLN